MFTLKDFIPRLKSYVHVVQNNIYSARQESTAQELSFDKTQLYQHHSKQYNRKELPRNVSLKGSFQ